VGSIAAFVILMLCAAGTSLAADPHDAATPAPHAETATAPHDAHAAPAANQPLLPPPGIRWPTVMMFIVVGMFIAAAVIGWAVSTEGPVEQAHDDSHGHGHGHGHDESHGDSGHGHGHTNRPRTPLDGHGGHH